MLYRLCRDRTKIVSEQDQEIPQSQTADKPTAPRGRATQQSLDTRKTNQANKSALSSPSRLLQNQNVHKVTYNKTLGNGSNKKQQVKDNRTTTLERTAAKATRGLKCILLVPNLGLSDIC